MNFISHYYFDHSKNDDHFNFGLILPDLARNFVPGTRIRTGIVSTDNQEVRSINHGCIQHVRSDKIFHEWEGFLNLQGTVLEKLRLAGELRPQRDWFVAHIFTELMIDHQLLVQYPELANRMYNSFGKINTGSLALFFREKGIGSSRVERLLEGYDRFMDVQYLTYYNEPESIVYSLDRICTRMNIAPFDVRQKAHYTQLISDLQRIIVDTVTKLHVLLK